MGSPEASVGERFVQALLAKDWTRVDSAVDPEIDFRAKGRITNLRILCTGFLPSTDDRVAAIDLVTAEA